MQGCYVAACNSIELKSQFGKATCDANTTELRLHLLVGVYMYLCRFGM